VDRRAAIAALLAVPLLLVLPVGCGSQEGDPRGTAKTPPRSQESGSLQQVTLRIEGMT
jgi:hypothetical protein